MRIAHHHPVVLKARIGRRIRHHKQALCLHRVPAKAFAQRHLAQIYPHPRLMKLPFLVQQRQQAYRRIANLARKLHHFVKLLFRLGIQKTQPLQRTQPLPRVSSVFQQGSSLHLHRQASTSAQHRPHPYRAPVISFQVCHRPGVIVRKEYQPPLTNRA